MSRTDKCDPMWVKDQRYGTVQHDHRDGECLPGKSGAWHRRAGIRHWQRCPQRVNEVVPCGTWCRRDEPHEHTTSWRDTSVPCDACDEVDGPCQVSLGLWYCALLAEDGSVPPAWLRRHLTHAPARVEERRALGIAKKEYNAGWRADSDGGEGCEDAWEPRRTPQRNAWWHWV